MARGESAFRLHWYAHRLTLSFYAQHPVSPYGTHIHVTGGDVVVSTRERPKLFFDASGQMTHLFNGVCAAPACPGQAPCVNCKTHYWDYTLVAPLAV